MVGVRWHSQGRHLYPRIQGHEFQTGGRLCRGPFCYVISFLESIWDDRVHELFQQLKAGDGPLEISDAIPAPVCLFASELAAARVLGASLEFPRIEVGSSASQLQFEGAFEQLADLSGWDVWRDWAVHWVSRFGRLGNASAVRLNMSHSLGPTCPRFHVDAIHLRLIATLLGPGTQWLRPVDVSQTADGRICQTPDPHVVQQIEAGSVGLFKGTNFDPESGRGVVHRSPPDRVDRIVVTLDLAA